MFPAMVVAGILTVLAAAGVVASSRPLNSALFLILTLFLIAAHFALLGAHFIAVIQVLVYAGAIMVLVVFVIMLLGAEANAEGSKGKPLGYAFLALLCAGLVAMLTVGVSGPKSGLAPAAHQFVKGSAVDGSAEQVSRALFTQFAYPFEITGLLLLSALIGAVLLAAEAKRALAPGRGLRAMQEKYRREHEEQQREIANG